MQRKWLAGSALALVLIAAQANAADKIELGLSGSYRFYIVGADLDDGADASSATGMHIGDGFREHGVAREGEIHFRGQTTLDNGIKVGVRVELEAETSPDQIDNSYIFFDGGFGRVELGSTWGPGVTMFYGGTGHVIPGHGNFAAIQHIPGQPWGGGGGYFATYNYRLDFTTDKVAYYTPRWAGLQIGAAYTPDDKLTVGLTPDPTAGPMEESGTALNADSNAGQSQVMTIAANYLRDIGPVGVAIFGSYTTADAEPVAADDSSAWGGGIQLTYQGFGIGGSFLRQTNIGGVPSRDRDEFEVSGSYSTGRWEFGIAYQHLEQEQGAVLTLAGFDEDEGDYFSIGVTYELGPGILIAGGVQHYDYRSARAPGGLPHTPDGEHTVLLLGTAVSF